MISIDDRPIVSKLTLYLDDFTKKVDVLYIGTRCHQNEVSNRSSIDPILYGEIVTCPAEINADRGGEAPAVTTEGWRPAT